jgi:hypothetical protein
MKKYFFILTTTDEWLNAKTKIGTVEINLEEKKLILKIANKEVAIQIEKDNNNVAELIYEAIIKNQSPPHGAPTLFFNFWKD